MFRKDFFILQILLNANRKLCNNLLQQKWLEKSSFTLLNKSLHDAILCTAYFVFVCLFVCFCCFKKEIHLLICQGHKCTDSHNCIYFFPLTLSLLFIICFSSDNLLTFNIFTKIISWNSERMKLDVTLNLFIYYYHIFIIYYHFFIFCKHVKLRNKAISFVYGLRIDL